jgi:hypothetical protein
MYVRIMYACIYVCMYVCMYVRMYACIYVCMFVCMFCMYIAGQVTQNALFEHLTAKALEGKLKLPLKRWKVECGSTKACTCVCVYVRVCTPASDPLYT